MHTKEIMSENLEKSQSIINDSIAKEFSVNEKTGQVFVSRRGIARLSGVSHVAITKLLKALEDGGNQILSKTLQPFAGTGFEGDKQIPDLLAAAIIKHYAYKGNEVAQDTDSAIGAIGLRTIGQKLMGWEEPIKPTRQQLIELLVMPVPAEWEPRFSKNFYQEMERLTDMKARGHLRPQFWGDLTRMWVYDHLPSGVYSEIKAWQQVNGSGKKLHQFLSPEGIEIFKKQLTLVESVMQGAAGWREASQLINQAATKTYQGSLFYSTKKKATGGEP